MRLCASGRRDRLRDEKIYPQSNRRRWLKPLLIVLAIMIPIIIILAVCLGVLLPRAHAKSKSTLDSTSPTVKLSYASYQGFSTSSGVDQFIGMRFAAPPTGTNRWRAPASPANETTMQNATEFQPVCYGVSASVNKTSQSEDCLFLNVYTPANATTDSRLPVWVYIQGGGYVGDENANYNGTDVVVQSQMGLILVNFNYRVGAFGFLASSKIQDDGDLNVGLLDQRAALQWVQDNIAQFGGDPSHVVIHGASAGAGSVGQHLISYGGRNDGLFVGAVTQSPYFPTQMNVSELEWQFTRYSALANCNGTTDPLACLRSSDIDTLQKANYVMPYPGQDNAPQSYYGPCVDGDLIQDYPSVLLAQGKYINVPLMVGDEPDEGTLFVANASTAKEQADFMANNYPKLNTSSLVAMNNIYTPAGSDSDHAAYFSSLANAWGQATLICPGINLCQVMSSTNSSGVWNYSYNITTTQSEDSGLGVTHTIDTGAIFGPYYEGTPDLASSIAYTTYNAAAVPILMDYYISFVKTLSPNTYRNAAAPEWVPYSSNSTQQRLKLEIGDTVMEDVPGPLLGNCVFWAGLATAMEH